MAGTEVTPIRLGIAGAGIAVRDLHWPALKALGQRYEIVALAARSARSRQETGNLVGCYNHYEDFRTMIDEEKERLDAVLVSLPISMLYAGAEYAARAGLDVLCEKPAGQDMDEGRKFVALPERYGVSIQILENFRYRDDLHHARAMIEQGAIGDLYLVQVVSVARSEPSQGGFAGTEWRQKAEHAGGQLLDGGVHHMAAFHVLAGSARRVSGMVASISDLYRGPDNAIFTIEFEGGVMGQYTYSSTAYNAPERRSFFEAYCYGTEGSLLISDGHIRYFKREDEQEPITFPGFDNGYYNEFLDFYRHTREGTTLQVTPVEGFEDLSLLLRGIDASRGGEILAV